MARPKGQTSGLDGYVVIDKPAGMTSHDVVATVRRRLGERRVGHAGTLDPDATGVLVVAVGRSTRLMRFVTGADKSYEGEVVLGVVTSTEDSSGSVVARFDMTEVTLKAVRQAAARLTGAIEQVPPMVSAVHVEGRRLYELAREGIEVERAARRVTVSRFDVEATSEPGVYSIAVTCSTGTYVRTLAADLGEALGGGAHLRRLRRTRVGVFGVEQAIALEAVGPSSVRPPAGLLGGIVNVVVGDVLVEEVLHGKVLDRSLLEVEGVGPWALSDRSGQLLAVYEPFAGDAVKPVLVHAAPTSGAPASSE